MINKDTLLIEYLLSNPDAFSVCKNILEPEYFNKENQSAVRFIMDHVDKYKILPTTDIIEVETGVAYRHHEDAKLPSSFKWVVDQVEEHCRLQRTILAINFAAEMIAEGRYGEIIDPIKEAVLLSTNRDLGLNYLSDPTERLERMKNKDDVEPLGFRELDFILFGGIHRGGLNIIAAGSGGGKSYFMANVGLNWMLRGKNVLYISFELHEHPVAKRLDSMVTGVDTREILDKIDEVAAKILRAKDRCKGSFQIKYLAAQSRVRDIESFLNEYMLRTGIKPDLVIFDYLDLIMPNNEKVDVSDHFTKDKLVAEQLRHLMIDHGMYCLTASQLNRSAAEAEEHSQAQIAGGISKINTADVVFTIMQTKTMRDNDLIKIQFLKTRNSSGVGRTCYLSVDPTTVRYGDAPENAEQILSTGRRTAATINRVSPISKPNEQGQRILDSIKRRPVT